MPNKKKLTKAARDEQQIQQQLIQHHHAQVDKQLEQQERLAEKEQATEEAGTSVVNWTNQPCPLKQVPKNLITVDDIEHTITRTTFAKSAVAGIGCNLSRDREAVGRHVQRWRMGLDLHQFIEK